MPLFEKIAPHSRRARLFWRALFFAYFLKSSANVGGRQELQGQNTSPKGKIALLFCISSPRETRW
ncbi:MAG: hypothetical protein E7650_05140 [Ruminococcaceae bacterium]|nr:hypothetical protein [Oscillospiraceae bacterium]